MSIVKIRAALETRLSLLAPVLQTSWENALLDVAAQAHQRAYLITNATRTPGLDLKTKHEKGIFQVSVCYPINAGPVACANRAELIRAHFPAGVKLLAGGVSVLVYEWPSIGASMTEDIFYILPVSISYRAFTT